MRSLYTGILLSLVGTLTLSLLIFLVISNRVERQYLNPVFEAMDELELESAFSAFETSGNPAVSSYLEKLNQLFHSAHFYAERRGCRRCLGGKPGRYPSSSASVQFACMGEWAVCRDSSVQ